MVMKNTLAVWLCAMMLFQSSAYARSYEVREDRARNGGWSLPTSPVWTPSDFGVQHISLSGMLHVGNKPTIVTLLTFLKASLAANNTVIWHGRVTAYDPTTISLEMGRYAHHTSPNDIIFGTKPTFMLQEAVMGVQHKRGGNHNHTHVLELVQPLRWGMQDDHREGEPWVLRGHTPLTQHLEYCFCVNDWPYTALITEEMMELPPYIEPHSGTPTVYAVVKPLFMYKPEEAIKAIYFYAGNYAQLGFNSTILYERGTYIRNLHKHAATAKQMRQGVLKLMLWDQGTAMAPLAIREAFDEHETHFPEFDQTVLYNHALTAMYGMNTYIFLADLDEVLMLAPEVPAPAIHNLLMHGCLKRTPAASSFLVLRWKFPACTMTQVDRFAECLRSHMYNNDSVVPYRDEFSWAGKALHFVDDIHSASMHWPKAYVVPSEDAEVVKEQCAFIATADSWVKHFNWDGVFDNAIIKSIENGRTGFVGGRKRVKKTVHA